MVDYIGLLADVTEKRDKLTALIDALSAFVDETPATTSKPPRKAKRSVAPFSSRDQSEGTSERDEAILVTLRKNGGMATSKMLRAAMPKEQGLSALQQMRAYANTMSRLKRLGKVARTGDTWSLL